MRNIWWCEADVTDVGMLVPSKAFQSRLGVFPQSVATSWVYISPCWSSAAIIQHENWFTIMQLSRLTHIGVHKPLRALSKILNFAQCLLSCTVNASAPNVAVSPTPEPSATNGKLIAPWSLQWNIKLWPPLHPWATKGWVEEGWNVELQLRFRKKRNTVSGLRFSSGNQAPLQVGWWAAARWPCCTLTVDRSTSRKCAK